MPKPKKKVAPGQSLAKTIRWRKKPLKKRAKIMARYWRTRAKAILREKRVEKVELLDRVFERSFLKLGKDPAALRMFCDRDITRVNKKIEGLKNQLSASFNETAKSKPPPIDKPRHLWAKEEKANYLKWAKKIRKERRLEKDIKHLKTEIIWLKNLKKGAL